MPDIAASLAPVVSHQTEFVNLNNELNKNVKFFTQCVESLIENFKSNEEMSDMKKVRGEERRRGLVTRLTF